MLVNRMPTTKREPKTPVPQQALPPRLVFRLAEGSQMIAVPVAQRITVGRSSRSRHADVDLNRFEGVKYGVSRQHSLLTYEDEILYIEDLHSTNGTRINGKRIAPGERCRLRSGDEIEFGKLRLCLMIVGAPG